ncbi:MAG: histidine phosphatase family protein [Bacteroidetes bacterium]|nr:histidine phosphatase family protein [Bacteroidota bacterium]
MKKIILLRHFESDKNIANRFSSSIDTDSLSIISDDYIKLYSQNLLIINSYFAIEEIHCSDSLRAFNTAKIITNKLPYKKIIKHKEFISIKYKSEGISEEDAIRIDPKFIQGLNLYRKGLYSSYDIKTPIGSESVHDFEVRVINCFNSILRKNNSQIYLFVLHRSPITSILINIAREYYNYPKNFFGFIELDLGKGSLLMEDDNKNISIEAVNEDIDVIMKRIIEQN